MEIDLISMLIGISIGLIVGALAVYAVRPREIEA